MCKAIGDVEIRPEKQGGVRSQKVYRCLSRREAPAQF